MIYKLMNDKYFVIDASLLDGVINQDLNINQNNVNVQQQPAGFDIETAFDEASPGTQRKLVSKWMRENSEKKENNKVVIGTRGGPIVIVILTVLSVVSGARLSNTNFTIAFLMEFTKSITDFWKALVSLFLDVFLLRIHCHRP
jgi:hypothetical protein